MNLRPISAFVSALVLVCTLWACTQEDPTPPPADTWTQKKMLYLLESRLWRVESVLKKSSAGTVDLANDDAFAYKNYIDYRKVPIFWFSGGYIKFYSSSKIPNTQFADSVETILATRKIDYPTPATYAWDEAKKNVVLSTNSRCASNMLIPRGRLAVVDKPSILLYNTIEEAKAAKVHENLTLLSEDTDPVLGKVTYIFNLKPVWQYRKLDDTSHTYYYAIF